MDSVSSTTDASGSTSSSGGTMGVSDTSGSTGGKFEHEVFVTGTAVDSVQLNGLPALDAICDARGAPGVAWKAVVRSASVDFSDRISIVGPVHLLDGTPVALDAGQFFGGGVALPINLSENLDVMPADTRVWVGNQVNDCEEWLGEEFGRTVDVGEPSEYFAGSEVHNCGEDNHLFCISQP